MEMSTIPKLKNIKNKSEIANTFNKIFESKAVIKKQESNSFIQREQISTQATESFELTQTPQNRYQKPYAINSDIKDQTSLLKQNYKLLQKQELIRNGESGVFIKDGVVSQISTGASVNTPLNTQQSLRNITPTRMNDNLKQVSYDLMNYKNKNNQMLRHQIYFISNKKELDNIFHRPVNREMGKFYDFLTPDARNSNKQFPNLVYKKLAPLTSIYNDSQVFESNRLNIQQTQNNIYPRYYYKQRKQHVDKKIGGQFAYKLINDITLEKKLNIQRVQCKKCSQDQYLQTSTSQEIPS